MQREKTKFLAKKFHARTIGGPGPTPLPGKTKKEHKTAHLVVVVVVAAAAAAAATTTTTAAVAIN